MKGDFGINMGTNPGYAKARLETLRIYAKDYPKIFESILGKDYEDDEDYLIFRMIADVDMGKKDYGEFRELIDRLGYSVSDIKGFYSMYLDSFVNFGRSANVDRGYNKL